MTQVSLSVRLHNAISELNEVSMSWKKQMSRVVGS